MSKFQIFSDGACDIQRTVAATHNIKIVPFYVSLDHIEYKKEIEELSLDTFYDAMINQKCFPKTSLPSVSDYMDAFIPALEEGLDIICYTITDTLSGSLQSANTAKMTLEETYPNAKIFIVNSWLAAGAQMLLILEAVKMRDAGFSIDEIYAFSEKSKADARIIFIVDGLANLKKGGRIGKIASISGSILNIKPLIILKDGEIGVGGVARSRKKGLLKLAALTKDHFEKSKENPKDYIVTIGYAETDEDVLPTTDHLKNILPGLNFIEPFQVGATIGTHTGPGTLGICFVKKFDAYDEYK